MEPVHVTVPGAIIAFLLVGSIFTLIRWMLRIPEQTSTSLKVAKAIRQSERASRILVPVQGQALSDRLVVLGAQMARARQATIEVFYVIEVPWTLPLNARLPEAERLASEEIERARRIAERYGVHLETRVENVREPGQAIVKEANATGADIILMSDLPGRAGGTRFGQSSAFVFAHALCEVLLDRPAVGGLVRSA